MKSVFIIDNGFNCFFSAYLNNPLYKEEIMEKLFDACPNKWISMKWYKETKGLLNEYCHLLDDIKIADANVNGEFLLSRLANLCSKVEAEEILEQLEKAVSDKIKTNMQNLIIDNEKTSVPKTMRTISKLKHTDKNSFHKMSCFSGCLFREMQETGYERVTCYTTNYDKITNEFFDIKDSGITIDMKIVALHGDYEASEIICSSPENKEHKVDPDILEQFEKDILEADSIVLFGLGLFSDPHLLKRLNMVKNKQIIIIDADCASYLKKRSHAAVLQIGFDYLYQNEIRFIDTLDFQVDKQKVSKPVQTPEELYDALIALFE